MTSDTGRNETLSIGQTLCSLREAKNISQADIASKMHLDARFIAAIESDDFDVLPPIYVRGYIRSYSKLVGADAETLVKLFEQQGGNFEPEIIPEVRHASQTSSSDRPVKAFTYLIIFVLAVLLLAWWQSNFTIETPITLAREIMEAGSPAAPAVQETPVPSIPDYRAVHTMDEPQYIPVAPADSLSGNFDSMNVSASIESHPDLMAPGTMAEHFPGALPPSGTANAGNPAGDSGPAATPAMIEPVSTSTLPEPAVATINTVALTTTTPAAGSTIPQTVPQTESVDSQAGPDLIVLRLTADSWIEITDANDRQVFFNLGRSGDIFNVRGTAPFDVLLGFAQAVSLEYNGEPFDAAPYSRAGVARFMLGE